MNAPNHKQRMSSDGLCVLTVFSWQGSPFSIPIVGRPPFLPACVAGAAALEPEAVCGAAWGLLLWEVADLAAGCWSCPSRTATWLINSYWSSTIASVLVLKVGLQIISTLSNAKKMMMIDDDINCSCTIDLVKLWKACTCSSYKWREKKKKSRRWHFSSLVSCRIRAGLFDSWNKKTV